MIEENRIVTFMGKAGNRRADVSYDDWRKEPYIVEYYIKGEWVGHTCWKTEKDAEKAATKFTFEDK
jgi:cephalosporin hydroxylase